MFKVARNQIASGLSIQGYDDIAKAILYGGPIEPFAINRTQFTTIEIAQCAVDMSKEHHPDCDYFIIETGFGTYTVNTNYEKVY